MNRRSVVGIVGLIFGLGLVAPASAQNRGGWDGTWAGTTEKGGSVVLVVANGQPVQYAFRGAPAPINQSKMSGNTLVFGVGQLNGQVKVTRKGDRASYSYSDSQGGSARATLMRQ